MSGMRRCGDPGASCDIHRSLELNVPSLDIAGIVLAGITFSAVSRFARSRPVRAVSSPVTMIPAIIPTPEPIEVERLTLTPTGFEPAAIRRPNGQFMLVVDNHTGVEGGVVFRLDQVAGNRLKEVLLPREKRRQANLYNLTPGRYQLTEATHPGWVCAIEITP